jgi:hypothetical protein
MLSVAPSLPVIWLVLVAVIAVGDARRPVSLMAIERSQYLLNN